MEKYIYKIKFTVPYSDIDMLGHVNNAKYLTYFETVRTEHFFNSGKKIKLGGVGVIIARSEIDYKAPARWHDELTVKMRTVSVGNSSWVYEYEIVSENNHVVAVGKSVQVAFDYGAQKSVPIPKEVRVLLLKEIEDTRD
ncbi:MAG: acyl-CoA thioesterase [Nitrososphaerales archaeon]